MGNHIVSMFLLIRAALWSMIPWHRTSLTTIYALALTVSHKKCNCGECRSTKQWYNTNTALKRSPLCIRVLISSSRGVDRGKLTNIFRYYPTFALAELFVKLRASSFTDMEGVQLRWIIHNTGIQGVWLLMGYLDKGKLKAQVCHLAELASVLNFPELPVSFMCHLIQNQIPYPRNQVCCGL